MSESSLSSPAPSSPAPSEAILEQALRHIVQELFQKGNLDELTIKRVRTSAERYLDLEDGFYKNDLMWRKESKRIIESEVEAHNDSNSAGNPSNSQMSSQLKATSTPKKQKETKALRADGKHVPNAASGSKKRKKEDIDEQNSGAENRKTRIKPSIASLDKSQRKSLTPPLDQGKDIVSETEPAIQDNTVKATPGPESESEMSVVIDEKPKRKSKTRGSGSGKPLTNKAPRSKTSKKTDEKPVDGDADEIKRLQGWLVKCGIRKMWFKELAPYNSPKLKIQHLKEMLSDAGMTGRYSIEKATQIRNERELKADLEAVQEGDKQWGKGESDNGSPAKPRRRRLARGLQELHMFLDGSGGEETD